MADAERIVRVTIRGLVQGVGYRAWTEVEAERRGIRGFVRNRLNGNVEAVFAGTAEAVEVLCAACWKGPRLADVSSVEIEEADASALDDLGLGDGFRQLATC